MPEIDGNVAEACAGLAEVALATGDAKTALAHKKRAFSILDALGKAGRLPAPRKPLLDRVRN